MAKNNKSKETKYITLTKEEYDLMNKANDRIMLAGEFINRVAKKGSVNSLTAGEIMTVLNILGIDY